MTEPIIEDEDGFDDEDANELDDERDALVVRPSRVESGDVEREPTDTTDPARQPIVGQWYWIDSKIGHNSDTPKERSLWCCTHLGSNYALMESCAPSELEQIEDYRADTKGYTWRIHLDDFWKMCTHEPAAQHHIERRVQLASQEARRLMGEVQEIVKALGVGADPLALNAAQAAHGETQALSRIGTAEENKRAIDDYKHALVKAKQEQLPALFKEVEQQNRRAALWMKMSTIPLRAQQRGLAPLLKRIEARIDSVEIYAGLVEEVTQIKKGKPAAADTPIHLYQRRLYMDEECLTYYEVGGLTFENIRDFDKWLVKRKHWQRLLPQERCVVAMQVRRFTKHREYSSLHEYIKVMQEKESDKYTYLYIRNGEQLFRLATTVTFGGASMGVKNDMSGDEENYSGDGKLFPDFDASNLAAPGSAGQGGGGQLYAKLEHDKVVRVISQAQYEQMRANEDARYEAAQKALDEEWARWNEALARVKEKNPDYKHNTIWEDKNGDLIFFYNDEQPRGMSTWINGVRMRHPLADGEDTDPRHKVVADRPYRKKPDPWDHRRESEKYEPFNDSSVYYDEAREFVERAIAQHNKLVLVLQGLLDRSMVFAPHPPWQLYSEQGFRTALKLVYDDDRALSPGEKPDFEAYAAKLREGIREGSVTMGQQQAWVARERERAEAKRAHRGDRDGLGSWWEPKGTGPGKFARVKEVKKRRGVLCARFTWERWSEKPILHHRLPCPNKPGYIYTDPRREYVKTTDEIWVPVSELFCVSEYRPGDFRQFFDDPRTRLEYLKWAPKLLECEEYLAGNRKLGAELPEHHRFDSWQAYLREVEEAREKAREKAKGKKSAEESET